MGAEFREQDEVENDVSDDAEIRDERISQQYHVFTDFFPFPVQRRILGKISY